MYIYIYIYILIKFGVRKEGTRSHSSSPPHTHSHPLRLYLSSTPFQSALGPGGFFFFENPQGTLWDGWTGGLLKRVRLDGKGKARKEVCGCE